MSERSTTADTAKVDAPTSACPIGSGDVLADRFVAEVLIGEGMFAWIFSALDSSYDPPRRVALKLYRVHENHPHTGALYAHELSCLSRVHGGRHVPNVIRPVVPTVLFHDDVGYIAIEYIDGCSLRRWLQQNGAMATTQAMTAAVGIARGLMALHAAGLVHCDIKPTNIFVRTDNTPVLLDLGIAQDKHASAHGRSPVDRQWMTPRYASPEQLAGEEVTSASDIYSFGLVIHEMLTGHLPDQPVNPTRVIPPSIRSIVTQCLHFDPAQRPTAAEVVGWLDYMNTIRPSRASEPLSRALSAVAVFGLSCMLLTDTRIARPASSVVQCQDIDPTTVNTTNHWEHVWSRRFGNGSTLRLCGSEVDAAGNTWIGGMFFGSLDLGTMRLESHGSADAFLLKLDPNGEVTWANHFGDDDWQACTGLAIDAAGNVFISGGMLGAAEFGAEQIDAKSEAAIFVTKLRPDGRVLWSKGFRTANPQAGGKLAVDSQGAIITLGEFRGTVHFGHEHLVSAGNADLFLTKLDAEGNVLWAQQFGGSQSEKVNTVAVGPGDNIAITARFDQRIRVGQATLESTGGVGHFVAAFDPSGRNRYAVYLGDETAAIRSGSTVHVVNGSIHVSASRLKRNSTGRRGQIDSQNALLALSFNEYGQEQKCLHFPGYVRVAPQKIDEFVLLQGDAAPSGESPLYLVRFDEHDNAVSNAHIGHVIKSSFLYYHPLAADDVVITGGFEEHMDLGVPLDSVGFRSIFATRLRLRYGAR